MSAPMIDINPLSQFRWRRSPVATSGAATVATLSPTPTTERQAPLPPHAPDAASEMIALRGKSGKALGQRMEPSPAGGATSFPVQPGSTEEESRLLTTSMLLKGSQA